MRKVLLKAAVILSLLFLASCGPSHFNYLNPTAVNLAICDIDSTVATLHGYEPKENPEVGYPGVEQPVQETYDAARKTWEEFKAKCFKQDYKGAYELYCDKEKQGDFLVFLRHSSARFQFDREVLEPMLYEFEEESVADSLYLDALTFEYILESFTMKQSIGDTDYVPEEFPNLIADMGCFLSQLGRIDEAMGLVDDFAYAVRVRTGSDARTNWAVTYLVATFYLNAGQKEDVIYTLEQYKEYAKEHIDMFADQEEYKFFMNEADKHIQSLDVNN